jgi:hypothetical protein
MIHALLLAVLALGQSTKQPPPVPTPSFGVPGSQSAVMVPNANVAPKAAPKKAASAGDALPAAPQPPDFTLPATINAEPGDAVALRPQTKGRYIVFYPLDKGLTIIPADMLSTKTGTVCWAAKSGRYRILAYTAVNNVPSLPVVCTIIVGDAPPPPNPDPNPPAPDDPTKDPLYSAVAAAYPGDLPSTGPEKANATRLYVAYYRAAAAQAKASSATDAAAFWQELSAIHEVAGLQAAWLGGSRTPLKLAMGQIFPNGDVGPCTPEQRKATAALYTRFANILERVAQ